MSNIKFCQHLSTPPILLGVISTEYIGDRDEIGGVYLPSQLERDGKYTVVKWGGRAPLHTPLSRAWANFSSLWIVRQIAAVVTLCVICAYIRRKRCFFNFNLDKAIFYFFYLSSACLLCWKNVSLVVFFQLWLSPRSETLLEIQKNKRVVPMLVLNVLYRNT
jgi:hypothetical protein